MLFLVLHVPRAMRMPPTTTRGALSVESCTTSRESTDEQRVRMRTRRSSSSRDSVGCATQHKRAMTALPNERGKLRNTFTTIGQTAISTATVWRRLLTSTILRIVGWSFSKSASTGNHKTRWNECRRNAQPKLDVRRIFC